MQLLRNLGIKREVFITDRRHGAAHAPSVCTASSTQKLGDGEREESRLICCSGGERERIEDGGKWGWEGEKGKRGKGIKEKWGKRERSGKKEKNRGKGKKGKKGGKRGKRKKRKKWRGKGKGGKRKKGGKRRK